MNVPTNSPLALPAPEDHLAEQKNLTPPKQSPELRHALDEFMCAFENFKEANDARLAQIEKRSAADIVTEEKVDRLNETLSRQQKKLDDMALDMHRPGLAMQDSPAISAHARAFDDYLRRGVSAPLEGMEGKADLTAGSDAEGGYLVPETIDQQIVSLMRDISPMRQLASVRRVSMGAYRKVAVSTDLAASWVSEESARAKTNAPVLSELTFPSGDLYASPAATPDILRDAAMNVEQWLAEEIHAVFAAKENAAFIDGTGTDQPKGLIKHDTVADSSRTADKIGFIKSGGAGGFASSNPQDRLLDLIYALKPAFRARGHWLMNRSVVATIRKMKDTSGNYLWQPAESVGRMPSLLGFPVAESEDMPDLGSNKFPIAFGDFRAAYLIVDRGPVRVLRDPYSSKPYILFYTVKHVGGGVQNYDAVKLLKVAA